MGSSARSGETFHVDPEDGHLARQVIEPVQASGPRYDPFGGFLEGTPRWQYAVVIVGMINAVGRMQDMVAPAGSPGWELEIHKLEMPAEVTLPRARSVRVSRPVGARGTSLGTGRGRRCWRPTRHA